MPGIGPATALGFLGSFGWQELIILAILGILLFGKRLPEVGRSLGNGIVEFKKGLQGIEDELDQAGKTSSDHDKQAKASREQLPPRDAGGSVRTDADDARTHAAPLRDNDAKP
jgi:TatA/E family protein of Tat protein translocase